jgi:hypothetical protein
MMFPVMAKEISVESEPALAMRTHATCAMRAPENGRPSCTYNFAATTLVGTIRIYLYL